MKREYQRRVIRDVVKPAAEIKAGDRVMDDYGSVRLCNPNVRKVTDKKVIERTEEEDIIILYFEDRERPLAFLAKEPVVHILDTPIVVVP